MRLAIALAWLLGSGFAVAEEWTPPAKPDPQAILNEANDDARAKRYETALAKHVWFHENALKYDPSLSGVRLSFALSSWLRLAEDYPPALVKLKEIRDDARRRVAPKDNGKISFDDFMELRGINRELGEEEITAAAFRFLDANDPEAAERVFLVSQPALVKAKDYAVCGKYIESEESLHRIVDNYRQMRKFEEKRRGGARLPEFAKKNFINETLLIFPPLVEPYSVDEFSTARCVEYSTLLAVPTLFSLFKLCVLGLFLAPKYLTLNFSLLIDVVLDLSLCEFLRLLDFL